MKKLYIKLQWLIYKNRLPKLSVKKLIKLWNLFDIYSDDEFKLKKVNNVLLDKLNCK